MLRLKVTAWWLPRESVGRLTIVCFLILRISNVLLCNVTSRVSFWFVVTNSFPNITTIPRNDVEAAIRMNRNRINNAFLLTDDTLQFLEISPTLAPPAEQPRPIWLIAFGVTLCIIVIGIVLVVSFGIYHPWHVVPVPPLASGGHMSVVPLHMQAGAPAGCCMWHPDASGGCRRTQAAA
uniref:Collectrin, amino acid transport regulator n=1 Tax=Naja naja TaxID=35670 RepID=A0A8C6Y678_NAJNA